MVHDRKKAEMQFSKPSDFHTCDPEIELQAMEDFKDASASAIAVAIEHAYSRLQGLHNQFMIAQARQLENKRAEMREQFSDMIAQRQRDEIQKVLKKKGVMDFLIENGIDIGDMVEQIRSK